MLGVMEAGFGSLPVFNTVVRRIFAGAADRLDPNHRPQPNELPLDFRWLGFGRREGRFRGGIVMEPPS